MSASNPYDASTSTAPSGNVAFTTRRLHIKNVDILSVAKLLGTLYALIGLVVGLFFTMIAILGFAAGGGGGGDAVMGGLVTGVGAIILLPLFQGIAGFLAGVIGGFLYNVVASIVGGLVFEVEG